jgi:hypothetical protein
MECHSKSKITTHVPKQNSKVKVMNNECGKEYFSQKHGKTTYIAQFDLLNGSDNTHQL